MADKLLLTVVGAGFEITMQGSGDADAAKAALEAVWAGYEIKVDVVEPVDMSGH